MTIEEFAHWGNAIGGVVVLFCLVIFIILSRRMGKDERSKAIFHKIFTFMFIILGGSLMAGSYLNIGDYLTGSGYEDLTVFMFAATFALGTLYLLILQRRH